MTTLLGFSDILSLSQSVGIIVSLFLTIYFSRKQIRTMAVDLETRVLSDADEKIQSLIEMFIRSPELIKTLWNVPEKINRELPTAYYALFIGSHIYHMRQRMIIGDNEWAGWLQWMKNSFRFGNIAKIWVEAEMESWFDPSFREFVNRDLMTATTTTAAK